jgi:hypothetical protein
MHSVLAPVRHKSLPLSQAHLPDQVVQTSLTFFYFQYLQTWLAGGFAIRVYKGDTGSMNEFAVKLRTLGAFACISALLMLLYVLHLGLFKHRVDGAPTAVAAHNNAAPVTTQKRVDDHHHNAAMNA